MIRLITLGFFFIVVLSSPTSGCTNNRSSNNYDHFGHKADTSYLSLLDLKAKFSDFKLIYTQVHKYRAIDNTFFIFERLMKKGDVRKNRILVLCNNIEADKYKIRVINNKLIYPEIRAIQCGENDSFSKIETKIDFITIEESTCAKPDQTVVHEYYTFKWDSEAEYILYKYSIIVEQKSIGDEYPVEFLTEKDFGRIKLSDFYIGVLQPFKQNFPDHIKELLKPDKF